METAERHAGSAVVVVHFECPKAARRLLLELAQVRKRVRVLGHERDGLLQRLLRFGLVALTARDQEGVSQTVPRLALDTVTGIRHLPVSSLDCNSFRPENRVALLFSFLLYR